MGKHLQQLVKPAILRAQNDLFSLCVSGDEQVRNYLDFSDAYFDEDSYLASVNVAHNLASLYFRSFNEKFVEEIRSYAINYFRKILSNLGWEPRKSDKHTDALLRSFTISVLGKMNDDSVTDVAIEKYKKFLKSPRSLSPDLIERDLSKHIEKQLVSFLNDIPRTRRFFGREKELDNMAALLDSKSNSSTTEIGDTGTGNDTDGASDVEELPKDEPITISTR